MTPVSGASHLNDVTKTYPVEGLTCGHCVAAVTEEVMALRPVSSVDVHLVAGATSTVSVTTSTVLDDADVESALARAGDYRVVSGN